LVRAYDTSCRQGERYIDSAGNWASITNCPLTDSNGHYFFSTRIVEGDGFEYGRNYTVMVTCNAQSARETFIVDVMKPPDTDMALDFIVRYGGYLAAGIIVLVGSLTLVLGVVAVVVWVLRKVGLLGGGGRKRLN